MRLWLTSCLWSRLFVRLHKKEKAHCWGKAEDDELTVADTLEEEHCWVVGVGDAGAALVQSSILHWNPPQAQYNHHPDARVLLVNRKCHRHNSLH